MNIHNYTVFPSILTEVECDLFKYIQKDLIEWIYSYQKTTESVSHSNRGGWQSPSNFHLDKSFSEFKNYILNNSYQSLQHYNCNFCLSNMWININKKRDYNICHDHPNSILSGVFWIDVPDNSGRLVFRSPNYFIENLLLDNVTEEVKKTYNYSHTFEFFPKEGTVVLFPSHLLHHVEMNETDQDRISIAFNLNIEN
jgi:uncharacterized protein (TIGR02466 family)